MEEGIECLTYMEKWNLLIEAQFNFGGKKYANVNGNPTRETTDELTDDFGWKGILWTLGKYCARFQNLGQEKELLKLGCYQYIIWLKRGFHLTASGADKIIDTNVEIKRKHFSYFISTFEAWWSEQENKQYYKNIQLAYDQFKIWSDNEWQEISEEEIFGVFAIVYSIWEDKFSKELEHKEDIGVVSGQ